MVTDSASQNALKAAKNIGIYNFWKEFLFDKTFVKLHGVVR